MSCFFFVYNKKKKKILIILTNIVILASIVSVLILIVNLKFEILTILCISVYTLGLNLINHLLTKSEKIKDNYFIFCLSFCVSSSIWFFFLAFIIVIIGILTNTPGL